MRRIKFENIKFDEQKTRKKLSPKEQKALDILTNAFLDDSEFIEGENGKILIRKRTEFEKEADHIVGLPNISKWINKRLNKPETTTFK